MPNSIFHQLAKFIVIGSICTSIDFALYLFLSKYTSIIISKFISMFIASVLSYIGNKYWTFNDNLCHKKTQIIRYYIVFIINIIINVFSNYYIYIFTLNKLFSFIASTCIATFSNFILQKKIVFIGVKNKIGDNIK